MYWEHKETHARIEGQLESSDTSMYDRKEYTTAVVQWVYKPGFKPQPNRQNSQNRGGGGS